ncbi:hypothetical protein EAG_14005 [Camponotus floridanus]|uniref:Uncharacterized protein n=1 Tax=Camponotus floridanus TaxID=104421 RepID=E2A8L5_CAMFO|nr:hypothetical protein EAG_14005 [Camponotus floridanus]
MRNGYPRTTGKRGEFLVCYKKTDTEVCVDEGQQLSLAHGCQFYEVSAAESPAGAALAFQALLREARSVQLLRALPIRRKLGVHSVSRVLGTIFGKNTTKDLTSSQVTSSQTTSSQTTSSQAISSQITSSQLISSQVSSSNPTVPQSPSRLRESSMVIEDSSEHALREADNDHLPIPQTDFRQGTITEESTIEERRRTQSYGFEARIERRASSFDLVPGREMSKNANGPSSSQDIPPPLDPIDKCLVTQQVYC